MPFCRHVTFGGDVCVFEGNEPSMIWLYNLYTEQWRKYKIPYGKTIPSPRYNSVAVAIGVDIYMFGGFNLKFQFDIYYNDLFKLARTANGCFYWSKIEFQQGMRLPSPRTDHSGWGYAECLWIFGGYINQFASQTGYLNDHGDFINGLTNQLLCYDSHFQTWTNPQCFGNVPSPRKDHSIATIKSKLWLHGGFRPLCTTMMPDDFFEFDMLSHTWTQIQTGKTKPEARFFSCFSKISDRHLVLQGGCAHFRLKDNWILDLSSYTWRKLTITIDLPRHRSTGCCLGINKSVVFFGDLTSIEGYDEGHRFTFHVMLEPKSLQQLAAKVIYNQRDINSWKCLPRKLISQLGLTEEITKINDWTRIKVK